MHETNFLQHSYRYLTSQHLFIKWRRSASCWTCKENNNVEPTITQLIMKVHDIYCMHMWYHISIKCNISNACKCILIWLPRNLCNCASIVLFIRISSNYTQGSYKVGSVLRIIYFVKSKRNLMFVYILVPLRNVIQIMPGI